MPAEEDRVTQGIRDRKSRTKQRRTRKFIKGEVTAKEEVMHAARAARREEERAIANAVMADIPPITMNGNTTNTWVVVVGGSVISVINW